MPRSIYEDGKAKTVSVETAEVDVSNAAYAAVVGLFESLEHAGKIRGNGHHMAQEVAKHASDLVKSRWAEPAAAKP